MTSTLSIPTPAAISTVASHKTPAPPDSPAVRKLRKAAGAFESMLLSDLWKSMKSTFADSDDDSTDPAHGTLDDMGIQAMSSAVGKADGLGMAKLILKHLGPKIADSQNGNAALALPHGKDSALPADTFHVGQ